MTPPKKVVRGLVLGGALLVATIAPWTAPLNACTCFVSGSKVCTGQVCAGNGTNCVCKGEG